MVFESVVVDILNRYLKPYVKKLDTSQLKVGVWKGNASLDKLELKEDLFAEADLDVPLKIKRSFIGKLEMQIPWKRLTKDPLVITIDEIYIIVGPNIETEYNAAAALVRERKEKEKKIEKFNEALKSKKKKKETKKGKKKDKDSEKPDTFVEKLAVHLTKNLQVRIRDIHVRYEDSITHPGTTISAGATLHSLEVKSTDDKWVPTVVRETATVIYKLLELNCLGVYWNSSDHPIADLDANTMIEEMRNKIARPAIATPPSNAYLLSPITGTAKLKLNVKIDGDLSMPQLVGGIDTGDILVSLQHEQLQSVLTTVEYFERLKLNSKYFKYRPSLPLSKDKKGWWRYAITAVLEEDVKRRTRMWSWKQMKAHRDLGVRYQKKYHEKLRSVSVSSSLKEELQKLEDQLDWFNIMVYRKAAAKKLKKYAPKPGSGVGGSSSTGGASSASSGANVSASISTDLSKKTSSSSERKTVFSTDSKEAKREEKVRKEEQKAAKKEEERVRKEEEKARKEEEKARKEEEKARKKEKKGSNKEFFSKLKTKFKPSKKKDGPAERNVGGAAVGGTAAGGAAAVDPEASWDVVNEEVEALAEVSDVVESVDKELEAAREELYKQIGYVENEELKFPKEYVGHEIHVNVSSFTLELLGKKSKIGNLVTDSIKLDLYHRPATNAVSISTSVRSLVMTGIPLNNRQTTLVTSLVGGATVPQSDLVNLQLDISPIERPEMDVVVKAHLRPIQITYDFATVNALIEMFKPPKLIHFQELTQAASASWEELKSQTSASLQSAVRDRKQLELDITLQSPFLVVPEKGEFTDYANLIVADLGQLKVFGRTTDMQSATIDTRKDALEKFYDTFTVKLDGMQVLVAKPGEDWWGAMSAPESSPLHILDRSGFEITLLKSIVDGDAYLPSLRVEGTLPGFEVQISDTKLISLVKIASSLQKPPALITITDQYDSLPVQPAEKLALDSVNEVANFDTLSISSSLYGDEEEEKSESSLSPTSSIQMGDSSEQDNTAKHVFTDVSVKVVVKKVALKLTKTEGKKKFEKQVPLLEVIVQDIVADVVDRKWDTQGSVSMGGVAVLDHITRDSNGQPSYLMKTDLKDGNFIFLRFVMISHLGRDFAAKYTGLQDTVSAHVSLVRISLHRTTLAALLQYVAQILPVIMGPDEQQSPALPEEEADFDSLVQGRAVEQLNPNDLAGGVPSKILDLHFQADFGGIFVSLLENKQEIMHTAVTGFSVSGRAETDKVSVDARINDVVVVDNTTPGAQSAPIVRKAEKKKDILTLSVVQYNHPSHKRDPNNMNWVDTTLKVEMGKVLVNAEIPALGGILEFVKNLDINEDLFKSAATVTAETATVTANAIAESTKTAHRLMMSILVHAPSIFIPYSTEDCEGNIRVDLGEFKVSNRFMHAHEYEGRVDSVSILSGKTILDCIEIQASSVQVYRTSTSTKCSLQEKSSCQETKKTILQPIQFTANVNRNISQPSETYPNVDVVLHLDTVKFLVNEADVQAFLWIGETALKLVSSLVPPAQPVPPAVGTPKLRSQTLLAPSRAKRSSKRFSGFNTARPRSTTATANWHKQARLKRFHTAEGVEVRDVRVTASLKSLSLNFDTINGPLLTFAASDLKTSIDVYKSKLDVEASVDKLSLVDIRPQGRNIKVLSLAEHMNTNKVSSLSLSVSLDPSLGPMVPLGHVSTSIAQIQMIVSSPFVMEIVKFVMRQKFDFDHSLLQNASKAAQDGAIAMTTMTHDKYFKVDVTVHAPVLIVPVVDREGNCSQGIMVDMGCLNVQNTLLVPDQSQVRVGIDAYGIKLDSFKVSRVLLNLAKSGSPVVTERKLLQPFSMLLALERNLCGWYHSIPTLSVNLTMGDLQILLGEEDLEEFFRFGVQVAEEALSIIPKKAPPPAGTPPLERKQPESQPAIMSVVAEEETGKKDEEAAFEKFRVMSMLSKFELKLFKGEPRLSVDDAVSKDLTQCEKFSLASLQLVTMNLKVQVSSKTEVEVLASMKDIALINCMEETEKRNTGNRVVQHYTSNPLQAFTGKIEQPLININYILTLDQEHNIIVKSHDLLILSDVEFMSVMSDYFRGIIDLTALDRLKEFAKEGPEEGNLEDTLKASSSTPALISPEASVEATLKAPKEGGVSGVKQPLPRVKFQVSLSNFRVAVIEDVYTKDPQAISLNLSSFHGHVQLSESIKHGSLSVSDLGIATSSFFNLDTTTSWILLPCSTQLTLTGAPDLPEMDINGLVGPISLTLSPAVVRLIIHAVRTLTPVKETKVEEAPQNLWVKQFIGEKSYWFLNSRRPRQALPPPSTASTESRGEVLTLTIESVEIVLETEATPKSPGRPVVALNSTAVFQVFEWTGQLEVSGEAHVEATYYNHSLSVWEPILETLEKRDGRQELWDLQIKMSKAPPRTEGSLVPKPNFSLELVSNSPLQLTITKTSIHLIKTLVESYTKEYGKQVEGSVNVQSLTGAPYTVINKLGGSTSLFVQPGSTLKIVGNKEFSKLDHEASVDLQTIKFTKKSSHASQLGRRRGDEATIDIAVGNCFLPLKKISIDSPGSHYYTLVPKKEYDGSMSTYGLVVEVAITGIKNTVTIRSPIQFHNHLQHNIDIFAQAPTKGAEDKVITVLKKDEVFLVPIDVAQTHTFSIRPTGFGFTPVGTRITWEYRRNSQHMELRCCTPEDDSLSFFSQVVFEEESYRTKRNVLQANEYPHHIFHIYPPLIFQNLLPYKIFIEAMDHGCSSRSLDPGQSIPIHDLDIGKTPEVRLSVVQDKSVSLKGAFTLEKAQPKYTNFPTTASEATPTLLTLHAEGYDDLGYLKVGVFSAFWMINKTGLDLEYKEGSKCTPHPATNDLVLLSTSNKKSKIQLRALTKKGSRTDWTKNFVVNAVGTSGNVSARLGENVYRFGVEISLSSFTLTKMVTITPYYLLVNKTQGVLKVHESFNPGLLTTIPPNEVVPFWTLNQSEMMVVVAGEEGCESSSQPFHFKKPDNTVLQFANESKVVAVCLEVQESESATVITFSPYYHGCVPLHVINHFPDLSLRFAQNVKNSVVTHSLSARESLNFTWDYPLAKKTIRWNFPGASKVHNRKTIDVTKDSEGRFSLSFEGGATPGGEPGTPSLQFKRTGNSWIEVDESLSEQLLPPEEDDDDLSVTGSITSDLSGVTSSTTASIDKGSYRGYWKSFTDGLQRILIFTPDERVLSRIQSANSFSVPLFEASLSFKAIGLSMVDNLRKKEVAYISISPSGVIWQLDKGKKKRIWKTLSISVIAILEEAYQSKKMDVKVKDLSVNLETMEMYSPLKGKLRRTHYEGLQLSFTMTEQDYAVHAKLGHLQVDNQLPFSVYPQVMYPLPPPPTIASTTEPKPFVEASIILKKPDQSNVTHFKYVHILVQKISVNADLGFILSLVDFFAALDGHDLMLEAEHVKNDIEHAGKSLMETVVPELADDISSSRLFFDVLHIAPIKINLSFQVRSIGRNKGKLVMEARALHLFLDSVGVILTSVQDTEMKFSLFHLEYVPQTGKGLTKLFTKHYRNQALFELHTLIFGLDVLGNPVSVVRGVVIGAKDLFYEPFKGSVLGPEEFFEGLGIGLKSFFAAGVVGGLTGAGARITGAFGDVFAKLTFDDEFQEQRQQTKVKPPKLGSKLGGFAKNVFEGVTGVVTQPVKGLQKEGAVGLLKGTGKGLVGLLVRPTGGLVDLASGTLDFVTRKTKVGNFEISDVRPPRFIGRDGVIRPYSSQKAVGAALLVSVDEGNYVETDYYVGHIQVQQKPVHFFVITDRRILCIERKLLVEGWKAIIDVEFKTLEVPVDIKDVTIVITYCKEYKDKKLRTLTFKTEDQTQEVGQLINHGYINYYLKEQ